MAVRPQLSRGNVRCKGPGVADLGVLWKSFMEAGNGGRVRRERRRVQRTCVAQWWRALCHIQGAAAGKMAVTAAVLSSVWGLEFPQNSQICSRRICNLCS